MFSYWERESFFHYGHIVIGAGITGLSTAIELRQLYPAERILVLERGMIPAGASTRNAGFACMGSVTELLDDLRTMSESEVVHLFAERKRGLEILRQRLGDKRIGYAANGSYELIDATAKEALKKIDYLNELLLPVNNQPSFRPANEKIRSFGFNEQYTQALIENTCEGELHTGKMMRALTNYALEQGIEIKTGGRGAAVRRRRCRSSCGIGRRYAVNLPHIEYLHQCVCETIIARRRRNTRAWAGINH